MKVVINQEIGGFQLPDDALIRLVELGVTHYIQNTEDLSGMPKDSMFVWDTRDNEKKFRRRITLFYKSREEAGCDKRVVAVVEEMIAGAGHCYFTGIGEQKCNDCHGQNTCERLAIIKIPDDIEWYIHENEMGIETIHEKHRAWSA